LFEGKELKLKLAVDTKAEEVVFDWGLSAKEGSSLAKQFAALKDRKSIAGGLGGKGVAARAMLNVALPDSLRNALPAAVDDLIDEGVASLSADQRRFAEKLLKALAPTFKMGGLDAGLTLVGPDKEGKFTLVAIGKVEQGRALEAALREITPLIPADKRGRVEYDAERLEGASVHVYHLEGDAARRAEEMLGAGFWRFAFRDDRASSSIGLQSKEFLQQALKAAPASAPLALVEWSFARTAQFSFPHQAELARTTAKQVFGNNPTGDKLAAVLEGGDRLHLRIAISGKVLKFIAAMESADVKKE
jgi:hypothetical protein